MCSFYGHCDQYLKWKMWINILDKIYSLDKIYKYSMTILMTDIVLNLKVTYWSVIWIPCFNTKSITMIHEDFVDLLGTFWYCTRYREDFSNEGFLSHPCYLPPYRINAIYSINNPSVCCPSPSGITNTQTDQSLNWLTDMMICQMNSESCRTILNPFLKI